MAAIQYMAYLTLMIICTGCGSQLSSHSHDATSTRGQAVNRSKMVADVYASVVAAVTAAGNQYNPLSIEEDREYMGAVFKNDDGFSYSVGAGHVRQNKITVRLQIPKGMQVVAFWHTHGAQQSERKYFSDVDSALVKQWQKPFFMADASGILRVLQPNHYTFSAFTAERMGLGRHGGYAPGKKVIANNNQVVRVATHRMKANYDGMRTNGYTL